MVWHVWVVLGVEKAAYGRGISFPAQNRTLISSVTFDVVVLAHRVEHDKSL